MRLTLAAVGRLRSGPERDLVEDYLSRAGKSGRGLGFATPQVVEVEDKKGGGKGAEAALLARALPAGAKVVALDERGRSLTSPDFAKQLARWRDMGAPEVALVIGGADGLAPEFVAQADLVLSFGAMVWPHMLVRVMLAEQIYRSMSILAGSPYHRA